jgi:hypothetical protein
LPKHTYQFFTFPTAQDQQLQLVNSIGQVVKVVEVKSGAIEATLDLIGLPTGMYRIGGVNVVKE